MNNKLLNIVEHFDLLIPAEVRSQITNLLVAEVGFGAGTSAIGTHKKEFVVYVELEHALKYLDKCFTQYTIRIAHITFENDDKLLFNQYRFIEYRKSTAKPTQSKITSETTISEAIEILKQRADAIAESEEAAQFHEQNSSWSKLFRKPYKPHQGALREYEEACELNEWLNGKKAENGHLTIKEAFLKMSDHQKLELFHKRINSEIPGLFDEYLKTWWANRY